MRKYSYRFIGIFFLLAVCFSFSFSNLSRAFTCLPTCTNDDSRFLSFGGQNLNTFVFDTLTFGIGSPGGADTLEIGIFDGESGGLWDQNVGDVYEFTLFADPLGDGSGMIEVGTWTSDGSGGLNMGDPMPDNDWFNFTINNVPAAQAESGNYLYHMIVTNTNTTLPAINNYKVRSDGTLFIFPTDQPFGYESGGRGADEPLFVDTLMIIYPNLDFDDPACVNGLQFCDFTQPGCCLNPTTFDGTFSFFFLLEEEQPLLDFWDGDFDFGPLQPNEGPPFIDTDDPNTPPGIPVFADVPNTNEQTSAGCIPPDDNNFFVAARRPPDVIYDLISPDGTVYPNMNPSATNEWELFQINTEPGCAPDICDIEVSSIPPGIWEIRITGLDLANLNFIRGFDKIIGVDEEDNPVIPLGPELPPVNVPTFSEWGMLAVAFVLGVIGFYHLGRKKNADASSS